MFMPTFAERALAKLREGIIIKYLDGQIKGTEAASLLGIHPKSFSRLLARYRKFGKAVLVPRKPGPKKGRFTPANRTPSSVVKSLLKLTRDNPKLSLRETARILRLGGSKALHPSTISRIMKRLKK